MSTVSNISTQIAAAEARVIECRDLARRGLSGPQNVAWTAEADSIEAVLIPKLQAELVDAKATAGIDDSRHPSASRQPELHGGFPLRSSRQFLPRGCSPRALLQSHDGRRRAAMPAIHRNPFTALLFESLRVG
jgi:hypothetical protein